MEPVVVLAQIAALTAFVCALHALKPRVGLAGVYVLIGLFEAFLFFAHQFEPEVRVQLWGTEPASLSYVLFLPVLLSSVVILYALDGTRQARVMIAALIAVYVVHGVLDEIFAWHIEHPAPGRPDLSDTALYNFSQRSRLASMLAVTCDLAVVVVAFQFVVNRVGAAGRVVALFVALVAAMVVDGVVYGLVNGFSIDVAGLQLLEKAQAGAAAALPASLYVTWQLARAEQTPPLDRGALELFRLRSEIARTRAALATQRSRYQRMKRLFGRYVSPEVVEQLAASDAPPALGGDLREVTLMFCDIRKYTTIGELLAPTDVIGVLNDYFARVGEAILTQRGMINEIEGDGILAVFGAPNDLSDHPRAALRAAVDIQSALRQLNAGWDADGTSAPWRRAGIERIGVRIGVHTGEVVAGHIGGAQRVKYAVIGDAVNLTARVEELNDQLGTELLVTEATARRLPDVAMTDRGSHQVKGRQQTIRVFEPSARPETKAVPSPG